MLLVFLRFLRQHRQWPKVRLPRCKLQYREPKPTQSSSVPTKKFCHISKIHRVHGNFLGNVSRALWRFALQLLRGVMNWGGTNEQIQRARKWEDRREGWGRGPNGGLAAHAPTGRANLTVNFDLFLAILVDVSKEIVHLPHQLQVAQGQLVWGDPEEVPHWRKSPGGSRIKYSAAKFRSIVFKKRAMFKQPPQHVTFKQPDRNCWYKTRYKPGAHVCLMDAQ